MDRRWRPAFRKSRGVVAGSPGSESAPAGSGRRAPPPLFGSRKNAFRPIRLDPPASLRLRTGGRNCRPAAQARDSVQTLARASGWSRFPLAVLTEGQTCDLSPRSRRCCLRRPSCPLRPAPPTCAIRRTPPCTPSSSSMRPKAGRSATTGSSGTPSTAARSGSWSPASVRASLRSVCFVNPYLGWVVGREELPNGRQRRRAAVHGRRRRHLAARAAQRPCPA